VSGYCNSLYLLIGYKRTKNTRIIWTASTNTHSAPWVQLFLAIEHRVFNTGPINHTYCLHQHTSSTVHIWFPVHGKKDRFRLGPRRHIPRTRMGTPCIGCRSFHNRCSQHNSRSTFLPPGNICSRISLLDPYVCSADRFRCRNPLRVETGWWGLACCFWLPCCSFPSYICVGKSYVISCNWFSFGSVLIYSKNLGTLWILTIVLAWYG
jgi:hypothetical protein